MPKTIIFDTETTGLEAPEIIEAAWLEVNSLAPMSYGACFEQRYRPSKPISIAALATHHILDEELVDCPTSSEFALPAIVSISIPMVIREGKPCGLKRMSGVIPEAVNGISSWGHSIAITPF
jgi:hypothetical protein